MNKIGVVLSSGVAAATAAYTALSKRDTAAGGDVAVGDTISRPSPLKREPGIDGAQRITGATAATVITGHDADESDPLRPDHRLTEADAKAIRAQSRKRRTSPSGANGVNTTREEMYRDPARDSGGESGTQGGVTGRENNNPVGRHK